MKYGHYIQSQYMGISFIPVVGIPSLLRAAGTSKASGMEHGERWFERWANDLGGHYFDKKYGTGAKGYDSSSPNFFNKELFNSGDFTPTPTTITYINPRTGIPNFWKAYKSSISKWTFWDFIW